jgi:prepilin-type N-terminal cleavage/methylation domain-containing protein
MKKKFTLIELLVVIAIIGILVSILLPSLNKASRKAKVAVCLGNQKQLHLATQGFLYDNNARFPYVSFPGLDPNTGRYWIGKKGSGSKYSVNVTERPVNQYLGYFKDDIDAPITRCPFDLALKKYNKVGSNYMAAARMEHEDDFDSENNDNSIFLAQVNRASTIDHGSVWRDGSLALFV